MNLTSRFIRPNFGTTFRVIIAALIIQIIAANTIPLTSEFQNPQNGNNLSPLHPYQSSKDYQIQLQIFEKEIQHFAVIFPQQYEENHDCRTEDNSPPSSGSFDSSKLVILENAVGHFQQILERLNASTQLSIKDKSRVAKLKTTIEEKKKTLDIVRRHIEEGILIPSNRDRFANADASRTFCENKEDIIEKLDKILLNGTVSAIQQLQFILADEHLQMIDDATYEKVVEIVYNHSENNIDLLQSFGDYISGADRKFKIFGALFNQMRINGHQDIWKVIRIGESLIKDVLGRTTNTFSAQSLFNTLCDAIQTAAIDMISKWFLNDGSWFDTQFISGSLVHDFPQLAQNIYDEVINKVFDTLGAENIINEAEKLVHVESEMWVHLAIFRKLESKGELNTNPSIALARSMKEVMERDGYPKVPSYWKSPYENMKNELPESVKNLVFLSEVCIKNSYNNEYLFADDLNHGGYAYDYQRRSVYTWIPKNGTESSAFKWKVSFKGYYQVEIINVEFKEQLFACASCYYNGSDTERRMAFTFRLIGYNIGEHTKWNAEVDGEGLQLKNIAVNEYLVADDDKKLDPARRYVFTHTSKGKKTENKWEIVNCSDVS